MSDLSFQWKTLFKNKGIDIFHIDTYLPIRVTSKEINDTKDILGAKAKDARFLAKIDTRGDLPSIFKEHGLFLLPIKNGEFLILKGEGFCDIQDLDPTVLDFEAKLKFELLSSQIGNSEMQHLDYTFNAGLLHQHYKADVLHQTIRGRKFTPAFSFQFNSNSINVEGVQIEVDGGYEGEEILTLIEAKNIKTDNFVIRQLYYPFRAWKHNIPNKDIKLSFFTHNNGIYTLHDFFFSDPNNYNSIEQLKTAHYRIVSSRKISSFKLPLNPSGKNIIPQADDLHKVIGLVEYVSKGITTSQSMADALGFDKRQSSYYREAAEALGFIYIANNEYHLTEAGKALISKKDKDRNNFLAEQIMNIPIFFKVFSNLIEGQTKITKLQLAETIENISHLNSTTANRRSSTILSWLKWFEKEIGFIKVVDNSIQLK